MRWTLQRAAKAAQAQIERDEDEAYARNAVMDRQATEMNAQTRGPDPGYDVPGWIRVNDAPSTAITISDKKGQPMLETTAGGKDSLAQILLGPGRSGGKGKKEIGEIEIGA